MPHHESSHTPAELSRLGLEILDRLAGSELGPEAEGKFIAIDVESGDYVVDASDYEAIVKLRSQTPGADIWLGRVGELATCRIRASR